MTADKKAEVEVIEAARVAVSFWESPDDAHPEMLNYAMNILREKIRDYYAAVVSDQTHIRAKRALGYREIASGGV